jgi:hypothetical protein
MCGKRLDGIEADVSGYYSKQEKLVGMLSGHRPKQKILWPIYF